MLSSSIREFSLYKIKQDPFGWMVVEAAVEKWLLSFLPQVVFGYLKMLFLVERAKESLSCT